jgi:hypothetical protein
MTTINTETVYIQELLSSIQIRYRDEGIIDVHKVGQIKNKLGQKLLKYAKEQTKWSVKHKDAVNPMTKGHVEDIINTCFSNFILAHINYNYLDEDALSSIKSFIKLYGQEEIYRIQLFDYLQLSFKKKKNTAEHLKTEQNIRASIMPLVSHILTHNAKKDTPRNSFSDNSQVVDLLTESIYQYYIHESLGNPSNILQLKSLEKMITNINQLYLIKYSSESRAVAQVFNEIERGLNKKLGYLVTTYKELEVECLKTLIVDSLLDFKKKANKKSFVLRTSIEGFCYSILNIKIKEELRKKNDDKKIQMSVFEKAKYPLRSDISIAEVYLFVQDGLDAIKHSHNGKARQLLFGGGRNSIFTMIIREALLNNIPKDYVHLPSLDYNSETTEAQQRADCKRLLIKWMKEQVVDVQSDWYSRASAIIQFICQKENTL